MALDPVPTYPGQYDAVESNNNPDGSETRREGDDQIRRMKASEKATWTNVTGAVTASHEELNRLDGISLTDPIITFPSTTTKQVFYQDSAPPGWTIDATVDEHSVRLTQGSAGLGVTGGTTGGTYDFGVQFDNLAEGATPGVGDHTLTGAESGTTAHTHPNHTHSVLTGWTSGFGTPREAFQFRTAGLQGDVPVYTENESAFGLDLLQSKLTPAAIEANAAEAHGHSVDLRVKWAACIVATKD